MLQTRIAESQCLNCGKRLDCATHVGPHQPKPGDATICLDCGHIMVFAQDMTLRNPTDEEMLTIAGDREILAAQNFRTEFQRWRQRNTGGKR